MSLELLAANRVESLGEWTFFVDELKFLPGEDGRESGKFLTKFLIKF